MDKKVLYCIMLDLYGEFLTEKQREFADLYYNGDMSLSEIAENQGITRQAVHDVIKRAGTTLLAMEKKLELADRELRLINGLDKCIEQVQNGTKEELTQTLIELRTILEE